MQPGAKKRRGAAGGRDFQRNQRRNGDVAARDGFRYQRGHTGARQSALNSTLLLVCYLHAKSALVHTHHGRLFRIDLGTMKISEEITVAKHEPRPVEEYYPTFAGDKTLCTDIAYFARLGEVVVLVYHRHTGAEVAKWKDTLLIYDVDSLARNEA